MHNKIVDSRFKFFASRAEIVHNVHREVKVTDENSRSRICRTWESHKLFHCFRILASGLQAGHWCSIDWSMCSYYVDVQDDSTALAFL